MILDNIKTTKKQQTPIEKIEFNARIQALYKHCAEGWSIVMSESKAGIGIGSQYYEQYKNSEHHQRIRQMYDKRRVS
jgi:hypothetical protein